MPNNQKGQTLLELMVVIAVGIMVIGALTFATIASLRNAQFAKNQTQATKLAQEGIEKVRALRDRDGSVDYVRGDGSHTTKFSDLWNLNFSCPTPPAGNCYFWFLVDILSSSTASSYEPITGGFERQIQIIDMGDGTAEKQVTSIVRWSDFSGTHESKLSTYLRKL